MKGKNLIQLKSKYFEEQVKLSETEGQTKELKEARLMEAKKVISLNNEEFLDYVRLGATGREN
jgi:hypothetical protein